jgi:hypothetical protein
LYAFAAILSRAQALDTQLEQRGLGAGSAAEALHVLERVASLENELTRCEQQVTASQGIMRRKHLQQQRIIHAAHTHAERHPENRAALCKGKYRTVTVRTHRSTAVIDTNSVCS